MTTVPTALVTWVDSHPRGKVIDDHGFMLNIAKWNGRIAHLRGAPLTSEDGHIEFGWISRGGIFRPAREAREDESGTAALHLFWQSLAWGTGNSHRNTPGRIASVAADEKQVALLLRDAARLAVTDPEAAFLKLQPNRPALKSWGPNLFSKYLYFAGGGALGHPSLIVDRRVLATLKEVTGDLAFQPQSTNYPVNTYVAACSLMQTWAARLSSQERRVGADEVERWAFDAGKGWSQRK